MRKKWTFEDQYDQFLGFSFKSVPNNSVIPPIPKHLCQTLEYLNDLP